MSDNEEEAKRVPSILTKYEEFVGEDYIRKGYKPIIKREKVKDNKTYTGLLEKPKGDEER